jgi:hypothetical protein
VWGVGHVPLSPKMAECISRPFLPLFLRRWYQTRKKKQGYLVSIVNRFFLPDPTYIPVIVIREDWIHKTRISTVHPNEAFCSACIGIYILIDCVEMYHAEPVIWMQLQKLLWHDSRKLKMRCFLEELNILNTTTISISYLVCKGNWCHEIHF